MRILVTNDDGVAAPGLAVLAAAAVRRGHEVVVAAPLSDHSGASASLVFDLARGVPVRRCRLGGAGLDGAGLEGVEAFGVDGSPALAVLLARSGVFGPRPSMVLSGVNAGANTGRGVLHSGTVGAALTAATMGMSGLAVSLAAADPVHWDTAGLAAGVAIDALASARARTVLNVNVPDIPAAAVRGVRWGRLAAFGPTRLSVGMAGEDHVELAEQPGTLPLDPETDAGLVAAGYVSVTPLQGVTAIDDRGDADLAASMHGPLRDALAPHGTPAGAR
ncbi:5'/3'-nucleotidase SurE [Dactylosporangium sp. NPDC000244]|uniref:5'/3'-nucleotidase SurE n=1 Tax=Dactylosporangium sp. NPDC000244 TaxID=3154365 RepID=UPI00332A2D86